MTMRAKIDSPKSVFTGVLPAEPGWRVVITNGKATYLVPVVGWCWERLAWRDNQNDDTYDLDDLAGEPFIVGNERVFVGAVSDVLSCMGSANEWRAERLLAPGKALEDENADGWQLVTKKDGADDV